MRACVLAFTLIAFAQPAFATNHSQRGASHHYSGHHQRVVHSHHQKRFAHRRRLQRENAWDVSGGMSQSAQSLLARADGVDLPYTREQSWSAPAQSGTFTRRAARAYTARASHSGLDAMIARHASANGLPAELVHRVVMRESGYNPGARNRSGATGLMQIKPATARGMGYSGSASGLLDAETNLTYAVRYLAGAYHAAGGNAGRAVALYQSGYRGHAITRAARISSRQVALAPSWEAASAWTSASRRDDMQTSPVALNSEFYVAPDAGKSTHRRYRSRR